MQNGALHDLAVEMRVGNDRLDGKIERVNSAQSRMFITILLTALAALAAAATSGIMLAINLAAKGP